MSEVWNSVKEDITMTDWIHYEQRVKAILERKLRTTLDEHVFLPLRGSNRGFRFDLVDKDRTIVIEIGTAEYKGRLADVCLLLLATDIKRKVLVITNVNLYRIFRTMRQYQIVSAMGIEVRYIDLTKRSSVSRTRVKRPVEPE